MTRRTLFISLARGGSKGVPRKNLRTVGGVPLIGRAARLGCRCLARLGGQGRVVVSTDDAEIAEAARAYGAETPFMRPAELAGDRTPSAPVVQHALTWYAERGEHFDEVVLLQPTTPLTAPDDVLGCIALFRTLAGAPVVAVTPAEHEIDFQFTLDGSRLQPMTSRALRPERQDRQREYRLATSVYVCAGTWLDHHAHWLEPGTTHGFVVPPERAVEIDDEVGLAFNETLYTQSLPWGRPRVLLIAEAGVNHNGDVARAADLVDMAADAGADAVKFQIFQTEEYASAATPQADYQQRNTGTTVSMRDLMRSYELPPRDLATLRDRCRARGMLFSASVFDLTSLGILDQLDPDFVKLPSGEITNIPMLRAAATLGRPMLLSTGMSSLVEVAVAVDILAGRGQRDLALLQCTSDYPANPVDINLRAMHTMAQTFRLEVGFSDHTVGHAVACGAVGLGARILEKHITLDKQLPGPDHKASADPAEFMAYVQAVRAVEAALGSPVKQPTRADLATARVARKSLVAARELPAGATLTRDAVVIQRPGTGIPPGRLDEVLGRTTRLTVPAGTPLTFDMLQ
ncbi:MAG: N-acetylneuraminate synthase family protein [Lentisphaerae bacterium]|nr:N-acetylneuraminate synthase family protein [Lentisphaerota bacterium]